ncbi:MAG: potassium channel family protein [Desulfobacterales bacterium]|nr:potassium channel family protein [Desulfobacterales bacterium]
MKSRFIYIIFAIMLVLLVNPFIRPLGLTGHLLSTVFIAMIPLASAYALTKDKKKAIVVLIIAAPFVMLDGLNVFFENRFLMVVALSFGTILYFYIVVSLVIKLLSIRIITADLIFCAISIYLLIGIMWGGIYSVLEGIAPGSFSDTTDLFYFSFVTLTTVGFGDVAPLSVLSRRLAVFEAAMGSIYMAVIIAMIVGRYMSRQEEQNSEN